MKINNKLKNIIEKARKDEEVLAVALFGSAVKTKHYRDIDVCIFLDKKKSNMEISKKHIEYVGIAKEKVDVSIFQELPLYIRIRVLREGKILYCRNEDLFYELAFNVIKEFDSYKKVYYMYLEEVENGPRKDSIKI